MTGIKGKRVPGRPGRFDPSMPLHMTTRRSAQMPNANDTSPLDNTSTEDGASRRASLEDSSAIDAYDDYGRGPSPKRQRTESVLSQRSTSPGVMVAGRLTDTSAKTSGLSAADDGHSSTGNKISNALPASQNGADSALGYASNGWPVAKNGGQSEPRKSPNTIFVEQDDDEPIESIYRSRAARDDERRRRYEAANGTHIEDEETMVFTKNGPIKTAVQVKKSYQPGDEGDWLQVMDRAPSARFTNSSREGSVASSRSDDPMDEDPELPPQSTDETPLATRQVSPATTASGAAELETPVHTKSVVRDLTGSDEEDDGEDDVEHDDQEENEDEEEDDEDGEQVATARQVVEEAAEVPADGDEEEVEEMIGSVRRTVRRRYAPGGRRRAMHSDAGIEAAMRRQLELKQFYRQVTRAMKTTLGGLAQITLDELETDPEIHKLNAEYEKVIAGLDARLERRKTQLLAAQRLNELQLQQRRWAEETCRKNRCSNFLADVKDRQLDNLEYNMLQIERTRQLGEKQHGHETEDEDGAIPRPKKMAYKYKRSGAIESRYDSRSRLNLETEARIDDLQRRSSMHEALKAFAALNEADTFTIMDSTSRDTAEERRRNVEGTRVLAQAAEEVRRQDAVVARPPPPPPTAADLAALQMLADLALQPLLQQPFARQEPQMYQPPVFAPGYPHHTPRPYHPLGPKFEQAVHRRAMSEMQQLNMHSMAPPHHTQSGEPLPSPFMNRQNQAENALAQAHNSHIGGGAPPAFSPSTSHARTHSMASHRSSISGVHPDRLSLIEQSLNPQDQPLTNEMAVARNQWLSDGAFREHPSHTVRNEEGEQSRSGANTLGQSHFPPNRPNNMPINSLLTLNGGDSASGNSGSPHNVTGSGTGAPENPPGSAIPGTGHPASDNSNRRGSFTGQQDSNSERRSSVGGGYFGNRPPAWKKSKEDRRGLSRREHKKLARDRDEQRTQRDRAATIGHGFRPDGPPPFENEGNRRSSAFAGPPPPMYQGSLGGAYPGPPFLAPWRGAPPPPPPPPHYGYPPFLNSQTQAVNHYAAGYPTLAPRPGPPPPQGPPPFGYPARRNW